MLLVCRQVRPLVIREVSLAEEVPETHLSTHQKQQRAEETLACIVRDLGRAIVPPCGLHPRWIGEAPDTLPSLSPGQAEELITEGAQLAEEREVPQALRLPLIRMVVDYTGFDIIPRQRFGAAYVGRVANPADMIFLKRARAVGRSLADEGDEGEARRSGSLSSEREEDVSEHMRSLVLSSLRKTGQEMQVLQRHDMADALVEFVRGRGEKVLNGARVRASPCRRRGLPSRRPPPRQMRSTSGSRA